MLLRVIFLKGIFKRIFIVLFCCTLFFSAAYLYLDNTIGKASFKTDQKDEETPYKLLPQNSGIVFILPDNSAVMAYLDFESNCINLVDVEQYDQSQTVYHGYPAEYNVQVSYALIEGIVDRIGGINLDFQGESLRFTGSQTVAIIKQSDIKEIKRQLIFEIFNCMAKNNFSKGDFVYIIENSKSNLSIVDCIIWMDYIRDMCKNVNFVN